MVRMTRSVAEGRLGDVAPEKQFWCCNGRYLKNLEELEVALKDMTDETFRCHVNEAKNDFSKWVGDVIGDDKLSRDLRKSVTKVQAARSVSERLNWLKSKTAY